MRTGAPTPLLPSTTTVDSSARRPPTRPRRRIISRSPAGPTSSARSAAGRSKTPTDDAVVRVVKQLSQPLRSLVRPTDRRPGIRHSATHATCFDATGPDPSRQPTFATSPDADDTHAAPIMNIYQLDHIYAAGRNAVGLPSKREVHSEVPCCQSPHQADGGGSSPSAPIRCRNCSVCPGQESYLVVVGQPA